MADVAQHGSGLTWMKADLATACSKADSAKGFGTDVLIPLFCPFCGRVAVCDPPTLLPGGRGTALRDGAAFGRFVAFASADGGAIKALPRTVPSRLRRR